MVPPRVSLLILPGLLLARAAADSAAGGYWTKRKGQDTIVYRKSDDTVAYTTSVDDTSEGSDTDKDITGEEEFFQGCLWTFRQQLGMCDGENCGDAEVLAHDMQRRLLAFYANRSSMGPPPLEEAAWMTVGTRPEDRRGIMQDCPGLIVTVLLFVAEVYSFTGDRGAERLLQEAEGYSYFLEQASPAGHEMMLDMFPVREAYQGVMQARSLLGSRAPTVDVVVAHCKTTLQWLWELDFPEAASVRVLVYGKCAGTDGEELVREQVGLHGQVRDVKYVFVPEANDTMMSGECTAYLAHIVSALRSQDLADYTVFLHDDGPRHIRLSFLALVMRGLRSGVYDAPFLHLSHERYPAFRTPCLKDVYHRVMGEELQGRLSTYCCSHFVVSRERIAAHSVEFYENIIRMVSHAEYDKQHGGLCNVGKKPCYVMEFMWHRIFGEDDELPPRAEQGSLPLALRYEPGRVSRLPSPLTIAPYMAASMPRRYSSILASQ